MSKPNIAEDRRIDPRIKAILAVMPDVEMQSFDSREELLAAQDTPEAEEGRKAFEAFMALCDNEDVSPSAGLKIETLEFVSQPDGNTVKIQYIRPDTDEIVPCVYYIHGGGMMLLSCFDGNYRAWGKDDRPAGRGGSDGGFPQRAGGFLGARGGALPGRSQRLRRGALLGGGAA